MQVALERKEIICTSKMLLVEVISKTYHIQLPQDINVCCVLTCNARIFLTLKLNVAPVSTYDFYGMDYESLASELVHRYTHTMYCTLFKQLLITIGPTG